MGRTSRWQSKLLVGDLFLLLLSLAVAEGALQIIGRLAPSVDMLLLGSGKAAARWIVDADGANRGNPAYWEHDDWGFRNERRPDNAALVAIGDSFTYGSGVAAEEAWPAVLSRLIDRPVYNMGVGQTGPLEYLENFERALSLRPYRIVVALWFGNDFVIQRERLDYARARLPSVPEELLREALAADVSHPWYEQAAFFRRCGTPGGPGESKVASPTPGAVRAWASAHSKLYGLARSFKNVAAGAHSPRLLPESAETLYAMDLEELEPRHFDYCYPFSAAGLHTIFMNGWRSRTLDDGDPRIRLGIEVAKAVLGRMGALAREHAVDFLVVLIPTKECSFWPRVQEFGIDSSVVRQQLAWIHETEQRIAKELQQFMESNDLAYLDTLEGLRQAGKQAFFGSRDAHVNREGHRIIAELIAQLAGQT